MSQKKSAANSSSAAAEFTDAAGSSVESWSTRSSIRRPDPLRPIANKRSLVVVSALMLAAVLGFGIAVAHAPGWLDNDLVVVQWVSLHHTPFLDGFALTIAWLFDPGMAVILSLAVAALVTMVTRDAARVATFLGVIVVAWGGGEVIKWIVQRPRPDVALLANPLAIEHTYSYPSGHTCFVAALGIALIFLARDTRWRTVIVWLVALAVVIVALSRVYLGVHYPTDVTASIVYSAAASTIALVLWLGYVLPWIAPARRGSRLPR